MKRTLIVYRTISGEHVAEEIKVETTTEVELKEVDVHEVEVHEVEVIELPVIELDRMRGRTIRNSWH